MYEVDVRGKSYILMAELGSVVCCWIEVAVFIRLGQKVLYNLTPSLINTFILKHFTNEIV